MKSLRFGRLCIVAAWSILAGCGHPETREELMRTPPPVIPEAPLLADFGEGPEHDHPSPGTSLVNAGAITLRSALSYSLYGESFPSRLILKIDLAGASSTATRKRPLNLALVFDRSVSMAADQKFEYAMQAARMVVENLSDRDVISLIVFNDAATVLSPAGRAINKEFLYYRLGQFSPEGYTNLSAGLLEAFAQIDSASDAEQTRRVFVLTDGKANRGITDPEKLRKLVEAAHARGIGVSTLGCGTEFDEKLLKDLAKAGGGRYTYVRSPELIPTAVAGELDGLLDVVAQNVKLDVRTASGAEIARVYGRLIDPTVSHYSFRLGDIREGERGVFLLEIAPHNFESDAAIGVDVTLVADNPETGEREQRVLHSEATFSPDAEHVRRTENQSVVMYAGVLDALEKAEEAIQGLDIERFRQARTRFDRLHKNAREAALETRDQQLLNQTFLLKHFMAELSAASESGLMHSHEDAARHLKKEVDYRRYLLQHHRDKD